MTSRFLSRNSSRALALLLLLALTSGAAADSVDRVIARINGEIVTQRELDKALKEQGGKSLTSESFREYLDKTLILQDAKRQKVDVSEDNLQRHVEEAVREIRGRYPDEKSYREALAAEGLAPDALKEMLLKRAKTDYQVFQAVAHSNFLADEDQVEYRDRTSGTDCVSIRLRRLAIKAGAGGEDAAVEKMTQVVGKINSSGLSFEEGVQKYSEVPEAKQDGGDLGWMEMTRLSAEVASAVRDLKPGQASRPLIAGGYANVFYVEGKRSARSAKLESRFNEQRKMLLTDLRQKSQVEVYSSRLAKVIPKEYASRVRVISEAAPPAAAVTPLPVSGDHVAGNTPAPAPAGERAKRRGLLGLFGKRP